MNIFSIALVTATLWLSPMLAHAQSGSSQDIGDTTFYNFDKFSGSKQSVGKTDFYNFSDGSSTTRNASAIPISIPAPRRA